MDSCRYKCWRRYYADTNIRRYHFQVLFVQMRNRAPQRRLLQLARSIRFRSVRIVFRQPAGTKRWCSSKHRHDWNVDIDSHRTFAAFADIELHPQTDARLDTAILNVKEPMRELLGI